MQYICFYFFYVILDLITHILEYGIILLNLKSLLDLFIYITFLYIIFFYNRQYND
jgi:hypothetical protein